MGFENFNVDDNDNAPDTVVVTEQASNRTFLLLMLALGGVAVLALACILGYVFIIRPQSVNRQTSYAATLTAQQSEVDNIVAMTATSDQATAIAAAWTATPTVTPIPPTPTNTATPTPVVAVATSFAPTLSGGPDDATATALHATLDANATLYVATLTAQANAPTPTRIPAAGFADDVGLPAMLAMAALLIVVIFLARRLRTA